MNPAGNQAAARGLDSLYERLADEEDARVCTDISEDACRWVPQNFFRIIGANVLSKIGDELANPKTVLAWVVTFIGAPAVVLGLLVPIRESGSMLPQLVIAAWVRRKPVRKWTWVAGSVLQCTAIAVIGLSAVLLEGAVAGVVVLAALAVFSLARGLCSVSHKDVLGKTIPKRRRGMVSGLAAGVSGGFVLLVGLAIVLFRPDQAGPAFYGTLLLGAGLLWLIAAAVYATIQEFPGATGGGANALADGVRRLGLLGRDRDFRRFVVSRSLLVSSALVAPFYVALAQRSAGGASSMLGLLILAGGLASSLSAPLWGRLADRSSRRVLLRASTLAGGIGIVVFGLERLADDLPFWVYPVAFLVLGVAHSGIRLGRKTYLVDMAGGNRRTDFVAVSNSVIGAVLLTAGLVTAAASFLSPEILILGLSLICLAGAMTATGLPEVET